MLKPTILQHLNTETFDGVFSETYGHKKQHLPSS